MTVVVVGIDALDPDLVDSERHSNLTLAESSAIDTIVSSSGEPSTHELWPTIITGLAPREHGLELEDGVAWENPILSAGSRLANIIVPDRLQSRLGAWLLTNTAADAFRVPATYYDSNGIKTVFDDHRSKPIGLPNYVTDPDNEDREHRLRRRMGTLFERDPEAKGGHRSDDPVAFYELCLEMTIVRIALVRRALRGSRYELVFGYTSGLDLIGHVAHNIPALQERAYEELDEFVGELRDDLTESDTLVLVSDHGLQDGVHTQAAMISSTDPDVVRTVEDVQDVRGALEDELNGSDHSPTPPKYGRKSRAEEDEVREHLVDLGYMS